MKAFNSSYFGYHSLKIRSGRPEVFFEKGVLIFLTKYVVVFKIWRNWLEKKRVERIEWYEKNKELKPSKKYHDKETPGRFNKCDQMRTSLKLLLKKTFQPTKGNPGITE